MIRKWHKFPSLVAQGWVSAQCSVLSALYCTSALYQHTVPAHCISSLSQRAVLPALQVFGVTTDPFIVYTSNLFAILSLRALYGFVASVMSELRFLDKSVAIVLGFVGARPGGAGCRPARPRELVLSFGAGQLCALIYVSTSLRNACFGRVSLGRVSLGCLGVCSVFLVEL